MNPGIIGRAIVLAPVALAAWWFLLKGASLWLLRILAWLPLAMLIGPAGLDPVRVNPDTGEWVFNVAVNTVVTNPQTGDSQRIESVEFAAAPDNVAFFACGWFSYLALALSVARPSASQAKKLLKGLALQTAINILSLAAYAYINGHGSVVNSPLGADPQIWLYKYFYHLIYLVVPFVGPFVVALLVHPEWRACFTVPTPSGPSPNRRNTPPLSNRENPRRRGLVQLSRSRIRR
jgi:hypothetical protein